MFTECPRLWDGTKAWKKQACSRGLCRFPSISHARNPASQWRGWENEAGNKPKDLAWCLRNVSVLLLLRTSVQETLLHVSHLHFHLHKDLEEKYKILTLNVKLRKQSQILCVFLSGTESPWQRGALVPHFLISTLVSYC